MEIAAAALLATKVKQVDNRPILALVVARRDYLNDAADSLVDRVRRVGYTARPTGRN